MKFEKAYKQILESSSNRLKPLLVRPEEYSRVFETDRNVILPIIKPNRSYNVSNHNFFYNTSKDNNIYSAVPGTSLYKEVTEKWERLPSITGSYLKNRDKSKGPIRSMIPDECDKCLYIVNQDIIDYYEEIFKKNTVGGLTEYEINGYIETAVFNRPSNYFPVKYNFFEPRLIDLDKDTKDTFKDMFEEL